MKNFLQGFSQNEEGPNNISVINSVIVFITIGLILIFIIVLLLLLTKVPAIRNPSLKLWSKLKKSLFWNMCIKAVYVGWLKLLITMTLKGKEWQTNTDDFSAGDKAGFLIILMSMIAFNIATFLFLYHHRSILAD